MDPALQSTLITELDITPAGKVSAAAATGMKQEFSDCVAAALKTIDFPKPKEPTPTKARCELTFRPSGG